MIRTQIYITDEEKKVLNLISGKTGQTKSELIRKAIDTFIKGYKQSNKAIVMKAAFGLWADRDDIEDFKKIRGEFDRNF